MSTPHDPLSQLPPVLVTGAAGFIGFHVCTALLEKGYQVDGVDNLTGAADPDLQAHRWAQLAGHPDFRAMQFDLVDQAALQRTFEQRQYEKVVHLAAAVGVRDSVLQPQKYLHSNLSAFLNLLEACRKSDVPHLLYASSSSVYGASAQRPFRESQPVDEPESFYAVTKRSNELMAHAWSSLHGLKSTAMRFFTVYGPWGRPDMAIYKFVRALESGTEIPLYNYGNMVRDFTYVDDVVEAVLRLLEQPSVAPILNVGGGSPVMLRDMIRQLEVVTQRTARLRLFPNQLGDVLHTEASTDLLFEATGFRPQVSLTTGLQRFVEWYRQYHKASPALASCQSRIDDQSL